jgi:hypothetical protein
VLCYLIRTSTDSYAYYLERVTKISSAAASCKLARLRLRLKSSFVARLARCEARRGKRAKQPEGYPQRYTEDFFAKFDEVAARIASTEAEDTF